MIKSMHGNSIPRFSRSFESAGSEKLSGRFGYLFSPDNGEHPLVEPQNATHEQLSKLGIKEWSNG